ncbi:hypothetical protein V1292_005610 [Bradyrhizobium sp. AZCC 1719]
MLRCMSPVVALLRHRAMSAIPPLLRVERTSVSRIMSTRPSLSAAIPDRPDRRARPARAEAAAIVATAVKAGPAEIVPIAIVPVITRDRIDIPRAPVGTRHARNRIFPSVSWKAVVRRLLIARQEAVAMPAWRRPFKRWRSRRDDGQKRQDDSDRNEAQHKHTIDGQFGRVLIKRLTDVRSTVNSGGIAEGPGRDIGMPLPRTRQLMYVLGPVGN